MCTAIVVVDGVSIAITGAAAFSDGDLQELQAFVADGVWPLFQPSGTGGWQNAARLNADGTITITSTSPVGNPYLLGVLVSSARALWR